MRITLRTSDDANATQASDLLAVPDDARVREALQQTTVREDEIDLVAVNGVIGSLDTKLHDGDELELFIRQPSEPPLPPEISDRGVRSAGGLLEAGRRGLDRLLNYVPSRLNLSWVTSQLAVGGAFDTSDIRHLARTGVTAVVDCRAEASDDERALRARGIDFLHLPTPDTHQLTQNDLERGVAWANERLARGQKVLVHCQHGVGRGPLLGCCVLVSQGLSPWDALTTVKAHRWQAAPNEEQLNALLEFASRHPPSKSDRDARSEEAASASTPLPLGDG